MGELVDDEDLESSSSSAGMTAAGGADAGCDRVAAIFIYVKATNGVRRGMPEMARGDGAFYIRWKVMENRAKSRKGSV
jgi:hypothetical protein